VAVAVRDAAGGPVAAVHVHGPSYRFPREGEMAAVAERVTMAANRIGEALARG
jgi:DNA-binding IclR family transcriptional regulator